MNEDGSEVSLIYIRRKKEKAKKKKRAYIKHGVFLKGHPSKL